MDLFCSSEYELRPWRRADGLLPTPPRGWIIVWALPTTPVPLEVAAWVTLVASIQRDTAAKPFVARDPAGGRWVLMDPAQLAPVREWWEMVVGSLTYCDCGGHDCLDPDTQARAEQVLARKRWATLPLSERIALAQMAGEDDQIGLLLEEDPSAAIAALTAAADRSDLLALIARGG